MKRYFLLWALFLGLFTYGQNIDGTPDSTFAGRGWSHLYFFSDTTNSNSEYGLKTFVQSDGKYLVLFNFSGPMLARYNTNGTLDKSFSEFGFSAILDMGNFNSMDAVLQSDGKIVVGGSTYNNTTGNSNFALARFTTTGRLDNTFGNRGKDTLDFLAQMISVAL